MFTFFQLWRGHYLWNAFRNDKFKFFQIQHTLEDLQSVVNGSVPSLYKIEPRVLQLTGHLVNVIH